MSVELKPCPFCGGESEIHADVGFSDLKRPHFSGYCTEDSCPVEPCSNGFKTEEEAVEAWNTRT
jgi:Lar family restriction alleviation protein